MATLDLNQQLPVGLGIIMSCYKYLVFIVALFINVGCAQTNYVKDLKTADFLDGYFLVKEEREHDVLFGYWKKGVNWHKYSKAVLEPVIIKKATVTVDPDVAAQAEELIHTVTHADQYRLREMGDYRVYEALKRGFRIIKKADDETLLMQFTINIPASSSTAKPVTSIETSPRIVSALKELVKSIKPLAGKPTIETRIMDAMTGELVMVSEEVVIGKTFLGISGDKLNEIEQTFQQWAVRLSYQLCQRQSKLGCINPDQVNKED